MEITTLYRIPLEIVSRPTTTKGRNPYLIYATQPVHYPPASRRHRQLIDRGPSAGQGTEEDLEQPCVVDSVDECHGRPGKDALGSHQRALG